MFANKRLSKILLTSCACLALASCNGDSTAELASPGDTGQNPGTPPPPPGPGTPGNPGNPGTANCPTNTTVVTVGSEQHCRLPAQINGTLTLAPGNTYQLNGRVDVGSATDSAIVTTGTLQVLPGVTVYAATTQAYLVVNRGSQILADGSADRPIIFTSAADLDYDDDLALPIQRASYRGIATGDPNTQEWGGIVINGRAPTNNPTRAGEGFTGRIVGGTDPADNSGILRYVQVRYAGFDVGVLSGGTAGENELNGIAFQAVGYGTTIDFVQVHNGRDDCFEWFGGTANAKHLICTGSVDDSLDWTDGWQGNVQYALVVANPALGLGNDNGIEADNLAGNNEVQPRSDPNISNLTIVGANLSQGNGGMVLLRDGTAGSYVNTVLRQASNETAFDIDGASSYAQFNADTTGLLLRSILITADRPFATDADDTSNNLVSVFASRAGNRIEPFAASTLRPFANGGIPYINGTLEAGVTVFNPTTLPRSTNGSDPATFFNLPTQIGAVPSTGTNWTVGWTEFLNRV